MDRSAVYWGVDPYKAELEPYRRWELPQSRDFSDKDFARILKAAREWLSTPVLAENIDGIERNTQLRAALDLAIRTEDYGAAVHPSVYERLLAQLAGRGRTARNRTMSNSDKVGLRTKDADQILGRLDRVASMIQEKHEEWGIKFAVAKSLVNEIDRIADRLEASTYGDRSMLRRQASVLGFERRAEVFEHDSDEGYMNTFDNPMDPIQVESDEPYMKAYADDQSSAVLHGKATNGRPLAP